MDIALLKDFILIILLEHYIQDYFAVRLEEIVTHSLLTVFPKS